MASSKTNRQPRQRDGLDDLLGNDSEMQDVFDAFESGSTRDEPPRAADRERGSGLGIDEEVTIVKKRTPIPKLDQERLLSPAGIPKLRRVSKEKLRFRGKGHEFSDVARLLNMYQFWLDDLYPRAKFADGLAIIEKLGHKKRMQIMRKAWIDESKPKPTVEFEAKASEPAPNPETTKATSPASGAHDGMEDRVMGSQRDDRQSAFHSASPQNTGTAPNPGDDEFDQDDLDALMAEETTEGVVGARPPLSPSSTTPGEPGEPDEDELNALLAAEEGGEAPIRPQQLAVEKRDMQPDRDDEFTDEMEAMRWMEDW